MAQQTDEIVIRFTVADDGTPKIERVNQAIKKTGTESKAMVPGLESARRSLTSFASENAALIGVLVGVGVAMGKVVKDHLDYANAVRQQAALAGTSTEAASRYLQVLDDYKITSQDALAATRALTKEGHVPSIETLARLSDQYLALNTAEEKNEFVLKNLGRGGLQWVEVLNKGSDALLKQGAAVDKNLLLTQKMVDDARRAEVAMDGWNDSIQALKTSFAVGLMPALTDTVNGFRVYLNLQGQFFESVKGGPADLINFYATFGQRVKDVQDQIVAESEAMLDNADAAGEMTDATYENTEAQQKAEEIAKHLTTVYKGLLSAMFAIQAEQDSYQKTVEDLNEQSADLAAEKDRLTLAMWKEKEAGKLTNDEYDKYIQNMAEITEKQNENAEAIEDAAADHEKAAKQRVYDLTQERFAADGVIDSGEFEYLQQIAVQKGLVSKAAADQAIAESQAADELVAAFAKTQGPMDNALTTMMQIKAMDGTIVNFGVQFKLLEDGSIVNSQQNPNWFTNGLGQAGGSAGGSGGGQQRRRRDSGGPGVAGTAYEIGVPEIFVAPSSGQFIPLHGAQNAGLGNTYNIVVNNPRRETAESSIRRTLIHMNAGVPQ